MQRGWHRQKHHEFLSATNPFYGTRSRAMAVHHSINNEDSIRITRERKESYLPRYPFWKEVRHPTIHPEKARNAKKKLGGRKANGLFPVPIFFTFARNTSREPHPNSHQSAEARRDCRRGVVWCLGKQPIRVWAPPSLSTQTVPVQLRCPN